MHSNLRLLLIGLVFGLLSALYPRLPSYLPYSITSRLPFLSSYLLDPDTSKTWQSVQRYQHSVPISKNYEHSAESEWEQEMERQLRFGSKEGGREMEKELKRVRREVEKRTEHAGKENMIKHNLPVYYLEQDLESLSLSSIGQEINSLVPLSVVVLFDNPASNNQHVLLSTSTILSRYSPSSKLVQSLLTSFSTHRPSPVPALSSSLLSLPSSLEPILSSLALDEAVKLTLIGVPTGREWTKEDLWDLGEVLHNFRHSHHDHHHIKNPKSRKHGQEEEEEEEEGPFAGLNKRKNKQENDLLELSKRTVFVSIGKALSSAPNSSFLRSLSEILEHSTSHARSLSLSALYSSSQGSKPTKSIPPSQQGITELVIAVEAAGEGEGEIVDLKKEGKGWRFGGLPIR
ncbi:hypothetical protein JCM3765_005147 [Sporobolomyces pararoseus]